MNKNRHSKSTVDTKPPKHTHTHTAETNEWIDPNKGGSIHGASRSDLTV